VVRCRLRGAGPATGFGRRRCSRHYGSRTRHLCHLAGGLGIAVKNASALLEALAERGIAIEVAHHSKRPLYGLKELGPLREEASPPRRPTPGRGRGRPPRGASKPAIVAENSSAIGGTPLLANRQPLSPLEHSSARSSISRILTAGCSRPIRRCVGQKAVIDRLAGLAPVVPRQSDGA
jgi:hypothetical protein